MFRNFFLRLIPLAIFPLAIYSVSPYTDLPLGGTSLWWGIKLLILFIFIIGYITYFEKENNKYVRFVGIYLLWNLVAIFRGVFAAEIYWDYKNLISNTFALLFPIVVYVTSNKEVLRLILSNYVRYGLLLFLLLMPFLGPGVWGWYLFPISFLMFFFPAIKISWKIILILITLLAAFGDITVRSHVIKYGIPVLLMFIFYFRFLIPSVKYLEFIRRIFMLLPWLFLFLAVSGIFNVFQINEYMEGLKHEKSEGGQALDQDSRTFLYQEVLESAQKYDYIFMGRTPARGNETKWFAKESMEVTGRKERIKNEAGILNVFTWTGVVGVVLFFLIFYQSSYLAVNKSSNIYVKLIGLFVAFRWMYVWVEDFNDLNMNCFIIYTMIGVCSSLSFRRMNNAEVELWARSIFEKKYAKIYKLHIQKLASETS